VITLVLGGVRSGKSEVAETLAGTGPVTYIATAGQPGGDADFAARIERHRRRRPPHWMTVEEPHDLAGALARVEGTVLVDALGMWVANTMESEGGPDLDLLVKALRNRDGDVVIVSEEVGLGVHPPTAAGRRFADLLGEANRRLAEVADRCLLVVAGRVVELPAGAASVVAAEEESRPDPVGETAGGLRSAFGFLTVLGGSASPTATTYGWLPLVGAVLGFGLGLLWAGANELFGPLVAAALVVAADLALTGALHFDGLVDSADGLLPHLSRERRLTVMAEPGVGAFGVAVGAVTLILRTAALATIAVDSGTNPLLVAALWWTARASMTAAAAILPYARPQGLASAFGGHAGPERPARIASAATIVIVATALGAVSPASLIAIPVAAAGAAGVHALGRRRIGGYTGDTLGAGGVVAETVGLLAAAAVAG
jgi:cobalamin 5'-phosphate synthase/cobalamin synthase